MTLSELYELSVSDFLLKLEGFREYCNLQSRDHWERTRDLAYFIVRVNSEKKTLTKYHLMQFPWDKNVAKKGISTLTGEEKQKAVKALIEKANNTWKDFLENRKN